MKHLYINNILQIGSEYLLSKKDSHHIINVIKYKVNDYLDILDINNTLYLCKIIDINKNHIIKIKVIKTKSKINKIQNQINLYFPLIRPSRLDIIFEKCTELNVSSFNPIITTNTAYPKTIISNNKIDRWNRKIKSSVQQCGRKTIPRINTVTNLHELQFDYNCFNLLLSENTKSNILYIIEKNHEVYPINIFVGPEGSFTQNEVNFLCNELGSHMVSVSNNILRTETACIIAVGICNIYINKSIKGQL